MSMTSEKLGSICSTHQAAHKRHLDHIETGARETRRFLDENRYCYTAEGTRVRGPWWPSEQEIDVNNLAPEHKKYKRVILSQRRMVFRDRLYEHGVQEMAGRMVDSGVIGTNDKEITEKEITETIVKVATSASIHALLRELATLKVSNVLYNTPEAVSLSRLKDLLAYSPNTGLKKAFRKVKLLSAVGIVEAKRICKNKSNGLGRISWDVKIGVIGWVFYSSVYQPLIDKMDDRISELIEGV